MIVFFDLETGGLELTHPIIELAMVATDMQYQTVSELHMRLKFDESKADEQALEINHYDKKLWDETAVSVLTAVQRIDGFLAGYRSVQMISRRTGNPYTVARLAAHNATFDGPRIFRIYEQLGKFLAADRRVLDTLQMALWYCLKHKQAPENYKLGTLCQFFGLETGESHTALDDCKAAVRLAAHLSNGEPK